MTGRIGVGSLVLGRYRLDEQVAAGGMGVLWRATDETLVEEVALKRVSFAHLSDEQADVTRQRTLREARLAAKLRGHPNVVALYDVLLDDGDVWLVLEYLPSHSLGERLRACGPCEPAEAAGIGAAVAGALAAAHALGIQHRDVAPGNVLIGHDGTVKLTDFGIAHSTGDSRLTQTDAVVGTVAYLAPEVARGNEATSASDVFSLGATLYAAVEGQPPFGRHDNPVRMLAMIGSGIIRPPERAGILTPLLLRMLELDPATRPDANTLRTQLSQLALSAPDGPPPEPPQDNGTGGTGGTGKPHRWRPPAPTASRLLVAIAVLAMVLVATLGRGGEVPGSPQAGARADGLPASVPEVRMGDEQRNIDSCALLTDASLRRFGKLQPFKGTDLGFCHARITGRFDDARVSVDIGGPTTDSSDLDGRKEDLGGVTVFRQPLQNNQDGRKCQNVVRLADNSAFYFSTYPYFTKRGKPIIDLCAVSRTAANAAVRRFASTGIPRAGNLYAGYPIAKRDACTTVDDGTLRRETGLDLSQGYPGFARWSCHWGANKPGKPSVSVSLQLREQAELDDEGAPTTVAGRPAYQDDQEHGKYNPHKCQLLVVHAPPVRNPGQSQAFMVEVDSPQPQGKQCAAAKTIATSVEQHLRR